MEKFKSNLITFSMMLVILVIALVFGINHGKKELRIQQLEQEAQQLKQELKSYRPEKIVKEFKPVWKPTVTTLTVVPYFPAEEIEKINDAAIRNGLKGELYPILYAIRKAENGGKGREFGIIHPKCERLMAENPDKTFEIQAGWAAATIQKNYDRWIEAKKPYTFIVYLAGPYCPIGADNDPENVNKNWIPNVAIWVAKIQHAE